MHLKSNLKNSNEARVCIRKHRKFDWSILRTWRLKSGELKICLGGTEQMKEQNFSFIADCGDCTKFEVLKMYYAKHFFSVCMSSNTNWYKKLKTFRIEDKMFWCFSTTSFERIDEVFENASRAELYTTQKKRQFFRAPNIGNLIHSAVSTSCFLLRL